MSYDLTLFRATPGMSPDDMAYLDDEQRPLLDPTATGRAVAALRAANPHFDVFESNDMLELTDLNDDDEGSGIQVSFYTNSASVTVPYWYEGKEAARIFAEIGKYLRIIHAETGLLCFDPQRNKYIDAAKGFSAEEIAAYADITVRSAQQIQELAQGRAKPWWKFW